MDTITTNAMEAEPPDGRVADLFTMSGGWREVLLRAAWGLGLAAAFGLSLGAGRGGGSLLRHALGVAAAPAVILGLGVPALCIVLASFDVPVTALDVARCAARGIVACGVVLAGLAPLCALYVMSGGGWLLGALLGTVALIFAGAVGVGHFHLSLNRLVASAPYRERSIAALCASAFDVMVTVAAARIWLWTIFAGGAA